MNATEHERAATAAALPGDLELPALVERARGGDRAAMESLLAALAPTVRRFARRLCGAASPEADDALQDALLAVALHLDSFEGRAAFTSWLFALTRSACARRRRGLKNQQHLGDEALPELDEHAPTPEREVGDREADEALRVALAGLPEPYREVLRLRDLEGLSASEAAVALGLSVDAVKSRLHRARSALRDALRPMLEPAAPPPGPECPELASRWSREREGDLSAEECASLSRHVEGCAHCAAACHALKRALWACERAGGTAGDEALARQVRDAIARWSGELARAAKE